MLLITIICGTLLSLLLIFLKNTVGNVFDIVEIRFADILLNIINAGDGFITLVMLLLTMLMVLILSMLLMIVTDAFASVAI